MVTPHHDHAPSAAGDRRFLALVVAAVAFALFSAFWIASRPGHDPFTVAFDDVSESLAALGAAVASFLAARNPRTQARRAWALIGLSALSWGLGQVAWTYQEVVMGANPATLFPSWPDLGYLPSIPLGLAGLVALPALGRAGLKLQVLLDALLIAAGVLFVSWATVLGQVYASSSTGLVQQVLSLAYPIGDVLMITVVFLAISRSGGGARQPLVFLGLGLVLNAVADSTFAYLTTLQTYNTENPVNVGWTFGYILIALAALRATVPARAEPGPVVELARWRMALPYVPMIGAGAMAVTTGLRGARFDSVMLWDSLVIVGVVLIRQFLLVRDTRRLDRRLEEQNSHLDRLVQQRTQALDRSLEGLREANEEGRGLLLRLVTMQDEERRRLSAIIHDDMLQWVTVGHTRLQIARAGISDARLQAALDRVDDAVRSAITRMRGLMSELHPQVVERGFTTALREYLEQVDRDGEIHCLLDGRFTADPSGTVATTLYRITCEAVVNARKHAPGATVAVHLSDADGGYAIQVQDDGPGFVPEGTGGSPTGHVGLTAMRERAQALGGWWTLHSRPGEGTRVEVCLPHESAAIVLAEGAVPVLVLPAAAADAALVGAAAAGQLVSLD